MEAWSTCRGLRAAHWSTSIRAPACLDNHRCRTTDAIPGARGCTPQSCSFRDYFAELRELGVGQLYGLSTQDIAYQSEAVERLNLPFAILSDRNLVLTRAIELPTFEVVGMTLLKRMVPIIDTGVISKVFYPVFPPDKSAEQVIATPAARVATPPPRRRRG
jgi:peroxiredoxin